MQRSISQQYRHVHVHVCKIQDTRYQIPYTYNDAHACQNEHGKEHSRVTLVTLLSAQYSTVPARKNEKSHLSRAKNKAYSSWS